MTAYAGKTDPGAFLAAAQSQYATMSGAPAISPGLLFEFVIIGGMGLLLVAVILILAARRQQMPRFGRLGTREDSAGDVFVG